MVQMSQAVAALKLRLAEIKAREDQLNAAIRQFEAQMERQPRQAMYGRIPLDLAIAAMSEIEERLDHVKTQRRHLLSIKERAQHELEALVVVQRVEEAQASLAQLKDLIRSGSSVSDYTRQQIHRLEEYIALYSKQAERAIIAPGAGLVIEEKQ